MLPAFTIRRRGLLKGCFISFFPLCLLIKNTEYINITTILKKINKLLLIKLLLATINNKKRKKEVLLATANNMNKKREKVSSPW